MTPNQVMESRNTRIVEQLQAGSTVLDVASTYNLSQSRVRSIRAEYAAKAPAAPAAPPPTNAAEAGALGEIGLSGLRYSAGYVHEEFLKELQTSKGRYKIFNEMRQNDAGIAGALLAYELPLRRVDWRIEGDDNDPRVQFVKECWKDMSQSWNDHISEVLTMLAFGFAPFEIVYKRRQGPDGETGSSDYKDGKIGWRKLAFRSQESLQNWGFDNHGNVITMNQRTYPDWSLRTIPIEKMILYRTTREKNNPEGRSLLRSAYVSYYYAKNLRAVEAIGAERDLAGLPYVKLPDGLNMETNSADIAKAQQIVRNIRQDQQAGLTIPPGWDVGLMASPGSKQFDVSKIIERYEHRISVNLMAQFLMLGGTGSKGSYALSKDQTDFFVMAISAIADNIADTFSQYAIPRLLKLNGMKLERAPRLRHESLGTPDLEAIGSFFNLMGGAGFISPDVELEQWARRAIDAPELTDTVVALREEKEAAAEKKADAPAPTAPVVQPGVPGAVPAAAAKPDAAPPEAIPIPTPANGKNGNEPAAGKPEAELDKAA